MKIALINENSQASKNELIFSVLNKVAKKYGDEVYNFGMYKDDDKHSLTYVKAGLLAGILLNAKVVDFVITGCGTGQGAMLALNSFPGVICGHITDPSDAFMFREINDGNAASFPFAKGFGWGSELTLKYIFEKLFETEAGGGYPVERREPEQANKKILDEIKKITHNDMITILNNIDKEFLYQTINREQFRKYYFENAEDGEIKEFITKVAQRH